MSTAYPKCRSLQDRRKNDRLSRTSSSGLVCVTVSDTNFANRR
jgi:hypothetical protein